MTAPPIDPELGLLRLPGDEPSWIWAFTCRTRDCSCRAAVVLAASGDREDLRARGAPVAEAWDRGDDHIAAAAPLTELTVFDLDLDTAEVGALRAKAPFTPAELAARPELRRVVERIDGEILEEIGRLWYLGKQTPLPEEARRAAPQIEVADWRPGELVSWLEMMIGTRDDLYVLDDTAFEALDLYCIKPGCSCGEVVVHFQSGARPNPRPTGAVRVSPSGAAVLEPAHARDRARLERLWAAFQQRHPRYRERFAQRTAVMQELGPRIVPAPAGRVRGVPVTAPPKVSRNAPCPCGSGKKHKKCCGAA